MTFDLNSCWDCPISVGAAAWFVFGGTFLLGLFVTLWRCPPGVVRVLALVAALGGVMAYIIGTGSILRYHVNWSLSRSDLQFRPNRIADFGVLLFWYAMTAGVILAGRKWNRA